MEHLSRIHRKVVIINDINTRINIDKGYCCCYCNPNSDSLSNHSLIDFAHDIEIQIYSIDILLTINYFSSNRCINITRSSPRKPICIYNNASLFQKAERLFSKWVYELLEHQFLFAFPMPHLGIFLVTLVPVGFVLCCN